MGTWGTAIFSDDLAADLREQWRNLIGEGLSPREATDRLVVEYERSVHDIDEGPVFWLALAVSQWKTGRLLEDVRTRALEVIAGGADLARWENPADRRARERVLAKARAQLLSDPPPRKKLRRRALSTTPFVPGDVFAYRHGNGRWFVLWVSDNETDRGGTYSDAELVDYEGKEVPLLDDVIGLPPMRQYYPAMAGVRTESDDHAGVPPGFVHAGFVLVHAGRLEKDRVQPLGNRPRPPDRPHHLLAVATPKTLDAQIDRVIDSRKWSSS